MMVLIASAQMALAQAPRPMTPAAPGTTGDPAWQGRVRMSDGRMFVTDGGLAIDAAVAKPATLPDREIPGKVLEDYMKAPHTEECALTELSAGADGRSYLTPAGIAVSSTYVDYLRRTLGGRARLRTGGVGRPIVVVAGGAHAAVLMPVKQ